MNDNSDIATTVRTRRAELARELGTLDPIEDEAITTGRVKMRMLDGLLERCEAGPVDLSDDEKRLLGY